MVDFIANLTYFGQGWAQYLLSIQLKLIIVMLNVQSVLPGVLYCVYIFRRQSGLSHFFDKPFFHKVFFFDKIKDYSTSSLFSGSSTSCESCSCIWQYLRIGWNLWSISQKLWINDGHVRDGEEVSRHTQSVSGHRMPSVLVRGTAQASCTFREWVVKGGRGPWLHVKISVGMCFWYCWNTSSGLQ